MRTVDIMEVLTNAIDKTILGEWKHEGFIGGFAGKHIDFEIDGKEYVLKIAEVKDGEHWSEKLHEWESSSEVVTVEQLERIAKEMEGETKMITKEQAIDILERFDFFQGQRAGRELWNDKPKDVQDKDISDFSRDCRLLIEYVKGGE